jgi:regulator of sigma E protease
MTTFLIFIAVLAILVLSHEFGHFIAARKSGMRVYEFGFGFPPRAFGVQRLTKGNEKKWRWIFGNKEIIEEVTPDGWDVGTLYSFNWIPIGGFVRVKGEEKENRDPDSFLADKTWKKAIFIVAGVACNIILAAVLFSIGYMVGLPTMVDNMSDVSQVKDRKLTIMQILPGKPAEIAGLKSDDIIVKIGDLENPRLTEMQKYVDEHKAEVLNITVLRGTELVTQKITPITYEDTGKGGIGVGIAELGTVKYPWYKAIWRGFADTFGYLKEIFVAFYLLIVGLFAGKGAGEAVSGPIGIAVMTGQVAKMGMIYLLQFTAILSLNLAVLNILPIPALDGGRLLFLVLNKFKKVNFAKYEQMAHAVGFILLMLLVVVVTVRDIGNFRGIFLDFFKKIF